MIIKNYYALYDNVAKEYFDLFYSKNDDTAKRSILDMIKKNQSFNSTDFDLYSVLCLSQNDDNTLGCAKHFQKICNCAELIDKE